MRQLKLTMIILLIAIADILSGCDVKPIEIETLSTEELKLRVEREGETGDFAFFYSFMLGKRYYDEGSYIEAIKYLKRAKDVYKKGMWVVRLDYGVDYWIGRSYLDLHQYQEAIEYLNEAASIAPLSLREIAFYPEDPKFVYEFEKHYARYIPTKDICYKWLITAYELAGQYQNAVDAFKKAMELNPKLGPLDVVHLSNAAFAYVRLKRFNEALMVAKKAIEANPISPIGYYALASVYADIEQFSDAISYFKKAEELDPTSDKISLSLAHIYLRIGKFDEAIDSLNKAISQNTVVGVGIVINIKDEFPFVKKLREGPAKREGIEAGDKIIKIDGQTTKGWDLKKVIQTLRGAEGTQVILTIERKNLHNPIEKTITRETIIDKSAAPIFGLRSLAYRAKGNTEEAEKDAQKAYSFDSNSEEAKEALGAVYIDKGKYDDAIKILSNTAKDNYFARVLEVTAYAKKGDYKKAVEIYSLIPEDYLDSKSIFHQSYKNAFLESLKPYVNVRKDTAKSLQRDNTEKP